MSDTADTDDIGQNDLDFRLETLEVESDDKSDTGYTHHYTEWNRMAWLVNHSTDLDIWAKLAAQDVPAVQEREELELVSIGIYGWWANDDSTWASRAEGYGPIHAGRGRGKEQTLAVIARDDETESGFAESASGKAYRFYQIMSRDGTWGNPGVHLHAPKTGVDITYGIGQTTPGDSEPVRDSDRWGPEGDRDFNRCEEAQVRAMVEHAEMRGQRQANTTTEAPVDLTAFDEIANEYGDDAKAACCRGLVAASVENDGENFTPDQTQAIADGVHEAVLTALAEVGDDVTGVSE